MANVVERVVEKTISADPPAAGTFSDPIQPMYANNNGVCNLSVYGASAYVITVTLQRSFDAGVTWRDVTTFTANEETSISDQEDGVLYRIGVKDTDWTSGSVSVRLSK